MKLAVTGATGHIGANMCRLLAERGMSVRALYRNPAHLHALSGVAVEQVQCDIMDVPTLRKTFRDIEVVIHLAAKISVDGDPDGSVHRTNVGGTENVVRACLSAGVRRLIHFSSIHAFKLPLNVSPRVDEGFQRSDQYSFAYDQSKFGGEKEVLKGVEAGLEAVILNPTAVIGPHDYRPSHSGQFLMDLHKRKIPALIHGGFDWVDVRDLCHAALNAIDRGRVGENYILSGQYASFREIAGIIGQVSGVNPPRIILPASLLKPVLPIMKLYSKFTGTPLLFTRETLDIAQEGTQNISSNKARKELGFNPRPLQETIQDTLQFFYPK